MNTDRIAEMITKRFKEARGVHENTAFYGFYARVSGESRELLKKAQEKATEHLKGHPSNGVLLDELMKAYLDHNVARNSGA